MIVYFHFDFHYEINQLEDSMYSLFLEFVGDSNDININH